MPLTPEDPHPTSSLPRCDSISLPLIITGSPQTCLVYEAQHNQQLNMTSIKQVAEAKSYDGE